MPLLHVTLQSRADSIANICDTVLQRQIVTCRDILMACLDMCVLSGLDSLAGCDLIPLDVDVLACVDWVAKKLLLATGQALCLRRPPRLLWFVLLHVFVLCTGWLFPGQNRWRKTSSAVERLWASAAVCRSLLWLSGQYRNSTAKKVGQLLEPRFRWVLWRHLRPPGWPKIQLRAAADELLHLQLQAVSHNTHSVTCTVVEVTVAVTMLVLPLCNGKLRKPPQVLQAAGLNTCVGSSGLIPWRAGSSVTG